ncbi:BZ3500_MvSof-1268-A1-R1_Chr1-3g02101 [Microbotryum saponariae]|uniref:Ammonium-dependent carbamoyl phosphate synthetase n=1 Tax=Microbotryum saponariae TaxID=289078 RepID=A0A2X0LH85_9BASI|nr:BZ3500_MvSof-1268-A1-R1_Chr1-3g02101 [Microbotryum saponariae]SCZ95403.1 BZ3501_MvSof-1269-A2-R1_Chr1-3g01703 [Microbotryum saponariae]
MLRTTLSRSGVRASLLGRPLAVNPVAAPVRSFTTSNRRQEDLSKNPIIAPADQVDISSQFKHIQTKDGTSAASDLARRLSQAVLPKLERPDVKKVLIVGSGGLSIGQAGEFDYSGAQAIKAMKESNVETILINPNIATIQTSHQMASEVYFLPITAEYVSYILERERPDGILLTFGGQTALNVGIQLDKMGIFDRLGVKVLGTQIRTLEVSEDRDLFCKALEEIGIPAAHSTAVSTVKDALAAAEDIGYPVILRSAFSLGGLGSGFAENEDELRDLSAKSLSLSPQVLIEKSLKGWKELEYEVVRDAADNVIICCNMEVNWEDKWRSSHQLSLTRGGIIQNFDPLGTHTGDSIVIAPSQTLSDDEYHMLRSAAIKIVRHVGVVGECNVQYALNPNKREYMVIEMNARLSRSSALASKATGYPLAYTAAKIALGHTLPELPNAVTKTTTACFEPSLDYIVTKIPKWDLAKFQYVNREVGSSMKSVGEVMAIGRTFEESLQKAIRQVDPRYAGFEAYFQPEDIDHALSVPTDQRLFAIAHAMLNLNYTVEKIHELTKIDNWFLYKLDNIVQTYRQLQGTSTLSELSHDLMKEAKRMGFSDRHISQLLPENVTEDQVRAHRKSLGITPFVKRIDTLAAEYPAHTNYLYTTYNASEHDITFGDNGTMVLGSGVYRIGSSVEFDWCAVSCARKVREMGKKTVMINYNPETVSTDFDEADRLYFEELGWERVMDIYELEGSEGVIVSVGGQLPQNIALRLKETGVQVLGTDPEMIDNAEDRHKFSAILDANGIDQPDWTEASSVEAAKEFANKVGYPVLIRPSYVLSGAAMNVVWNESTLEHSLTAAAEVSSEYPTVITKFIDSAQEIDIDAVAYKGELLVHAVSEHVENAGVHSGDATLVLPPFSLVEDDFARLKEIAQKVAKAFEISGPFNMQIIRKASDDHSTVLKVIECNLRASRSFPFVSKVLGVNFIDIATAAIVGENVPAPVDLMQQKRDYVAIKVPQFSWTRLAGADPYLGVEMASTGEVAAFGVDVHEAYWASLTSTNAFRVPPPESGVLIGGDISKPQMATVAKGLIDLGFKLYCSSPVVEEYLNSLPYLGKVERIAIPLKDKRRLQLVFEKYDIQCVVNLASSRGKNTVDEDYVARRNAVDFGIPCLNNPLLAQLFVEAYGKKLRKGELEGYVEGRVPNEVKPWSHFIGGRL